MNEHELQVRILESIKFERRMATPSTRWYGHLGDSEQEAATDWTVTNIAMWLRRWRGSQHAMVTKIWRFWLPHWREVDVDLMVSHSGRYEQFKLRVSARGPSAVRMIIVHWVGGRETAVWERWGEVSNLDGTFQILTLPDTQHERR